MSTYKSISSRKDRRKFIRGTFQGITLLIALYIIIIALFSFKTYEPYTEEANEDKGFIAVSYFGVGLENDDKLIGTQRLEDHIKALKNSGYVTITQKDIKEYYEEGKPLPERALFLMFEDGRRDTSIFAQKLLEKYNMIGTMFSYSDKFNSRDSKFLSGEDMLKMEESTFWELATSGYRLEYINVFDKENQFLGNLTTKEYGEVKDELDGNYNHYLMDYIRDEHGIPLEDYEEMKKRISDDYRALSRSYEEEIGRVPTTYALMHANTGQFGNNDKVSNINEEWTTRLFTMNFNREGHSLNTRENSIYDLTRMKPEPHWSTNQLLMRIWDDTKEEMAFVSGDLERKAFWDQIQGESEFVNDQIILTSLPREGGMLGLKESENFKDFTLSVKLTGNQEGAQRIYVRSDEKLKNYIQIEVKEGTLYLHEVIDGKDTILHTVEINNNEQNMLEITLIGNQISVSIDSQVVIDNQQISWQEAGSFYLEAYPLEDVYDGIFEELVITEASKQGKAQILFDNRLQGMEKWIYKVEKITSQVVNWFIEHL